MINKKLFASKELILNCSLLIILGSCSVSKQIAKQAGSILLRDSAISSGFIGISIYEPAANTYWYNYNATKYFTPASNTKLFTLFAGMKYLGDSLVGMRYETNLFGAVFLYPTADPTFLHPDFKNQPVLSFLKKLNSNDQKSLVLNAWKSISLGKGWAWDDYSDDYMAERNIMPVYGNVVNFDFNNDSLTGSPYGNFDIIASDEFTFKEKSGFFSRNKNRLPDFFSIKRLIDRNRFEFIKSSKKFERVTIPFITNNYTINEILKDTLHLQGTPNFNFIYLEKPAPYKNLNKIHSQPSDSLFKPMMYRSDNFFAEQTLLMVSNEQLGYMSDETIIDTLLRFDLKDVPQKPKWVDGSGLSRYNLFTPQSFIYILNKMKNEFGLERLKVILPSGGQGTLGSWFKKDSSYIYAKTGTLSNNCALSGFLITNKGKLLIFSILANHYQTGATPIRQATERFLEEIRKKY